MSKIRVLHVYRTYFPDPPGGLQEAIRQISLATKKFDIESSVFSLSPNPDPRELRRPEGQVTRARSYLAPASCDLGGLSAFIRFHKLIKEVDIVHYHFPWPFADALCLACAGAGPTIMTYHSDIIGKGLLAQLYRPLMITMLKRMNAVVATSPKYVESSPVLTKYVGSKKLSVIPLGIVEESYKECRSAAGTINLSARFAVAKNEYFLFVGVLRKYKGLDSLIDAARSTGLPVVIAGSGPQQKILSEKSKNIRNIYFMGQVTDAEKMALIDGCRAAILPSNLRSEAFGVFLLEAAMCGKPLISCEIGTGTSYVNVNGETGYVVAPDSPISLSRAMKALADSQELSQRLGEAARERYENYFSAKPLGSNYAKLYEKLGDTQNQ